MRSRNFFLNILFNAALAVLFTMLTSCSTFRNNAAQIYSPSEEQSAQMEEAGLQVDAWILNSAMTETATSEIKPMQDGLAILQANCIGCHVTAWFDQFEKSISEWEEVLDQMEAMGVRLSDTEKGILLNYLAVADRP